MNRDLIGQADLTRKDQPQFRVEHVTLDGGMHYCVIVDFYGTPYVFRYGYKTRAQARDIMEKLHAGFRGDSDLHVNYHRLDQNLRYCEENKNGNYYISTIY